MTGRHLLYAFLLLGPAMPAAAQDSAVATVPAPPAEIRPPLSPRRAFVYSLLVPGYSQSVLGRGKTGALILAFESVALVMIRESAGNLREARRNEADSVIVSFVNAAGQPQARWERTPFSRALVRAREEQFEDWLAVLVGTHLFAGIDAFVAAHLWEVPLEVVPRSSRGSRGLALRLYW